MKAAVSKKVTALKLATSTSLCAVDSNLNILRKEEDSAGSSGGWSQVAKGGSAVKRVQDPVVGAKSSFTVLGTKAKKDNEKRKSQEDAVDDWEKEVEGWGDA